MRRLCALCLSDSNLRKSHVIPRAMFRAVKNGHSQLHVSPFNGKDTPRPSNGDIIEKLLCSNCEHLLNSHFEDYSMRFLHRNSGFYKNKLKKLYNYDFNRLTLFFMSILWRCAISKKSPLTKDIMNLPDNTIEKFRRLLLVPPEQRDSKIISKALKINMFGLYSFKESKVLKQEHINQLLIYPHITSETSEAIYARMVSLGYHVEFCIPLETNFSPKPVKGSLRPLSGTTVMPAYHVQEISWLVTELYKMKEAVNSNS